MQEGIGLFGFVRSLILSQKVFRFGCVSVFILLSIAIFSSSNVISQSDELQSNHALVDEMLPLVESPLSPVLFDIDQSEEYTFLGQVDLRENGIDDLVFKKRNSIAIFYPELDGSFSASPDVFLESTRSESGGGIEMIEAADVEFWFMDREFADIDQDGHLDVALLVEVVRSELADDIGTRRIYVLFGNGQGSIHERSARIDIPLDEYLLDGQLWNLLASDFNSDSKIDLGIGIQFESTSTPFYWLEGHGDGNFGEIAPLDIELAEDSVILGVFVEDFDGDGADEILTWQDVGLVGFERTVAGSFSQALLHDLDGSPFPTSVSFEDLNGDSLIDAIFAVEKIELEVWLQNDAGTLEKHGAQTLSEEVRELLIGDYNGDGLFDLGLITSAQERLKIALGDGSGAFDIQNTISRQLREQSNSQAVGDFNADGTDDFFFISEDFGRLLLNQANPIGLERVETTATQVLGTADMDGDGDQDLILSSEGLIELHMNNGEGAFHKRAELSLPGQMFMTGEAENLDGDSAEEFILLSRNLDGQLFQVLQYQNGRLEITESQMNGPGAPNLGITDVDRDGHLDIAMTQATSVRVWLGNGSGAFGSSIEFAFESGTVNLMTVGDFDSDSDIEIFVSHVERMAEYQFLEFENGRLVKGAPVLSSGVSPISIATGDLNSDGLLDVAALAISLEVLEEDENLVLSPKAGVLLEFLSSSSGQLEVSTSFPDWERGTSPWPVTGLEIVDLNNDQLNDIAYTFLNRLPIVTLEQSAEPDERFAQQSEIECRGTTLVRSDLDFNGVDELISIGQLPFPAICIAWNGGGSR